MHRFRFLVAAAAAMILTLAMTLPASAAVTTNTRFTFTFSFVNPCAPADGLITATVDVHVVVQNGGEKVLVNLHGSGTSTNGTKYEVMSNQIVDNPPGPSFSVTARPRSISAGSSDNLFSTFTFSTPPPTFSSSTVCRG